MKRVGDELKLSATDLSTHAACGHLTQLRLRQHLDCGPEEPRFEGPGTKALRERGAEHERQYLEHLRASGRDVLDLGFAPGDERTSFEKIGEAIARTRDAVAARQDVIAQARFQSEQWGGSADALLWDPDAGAYRIVDTKLSRETKGGTILQLLVYAELLDELGQRTDWVGAVAPGRNFEPEWHRVAEYSAYFRLAKRRLLDAIDSRPDTYPEPVDHCSLCNWWKTCEAERRADDHLSLVAGISRAQRREVTGRGLETLEAFADHDDALWKPARGSLSSLQTTHRQANAQVKGRRTGEHVVELLPRGDSGSAAVGFAMLPEPDPGDLFFDIEGDRFAGEGGLEYLFGTVDVDGTFKDRWALNPAEEREMLEAFIDELCQQTEDHPDAHIYHYGHYETSALKRLAQRYGTREHELDQLLRDQRFVNLLRVVKTSLIASVEGYSIKQLEPLYGFERTEDLERSRAYRRELEILLEHGVAEPLPGEMIGSINEYNREDCASTLALRDWLEAQRRSLVDAGEEIARPKPIELEAERPREPDLQALIDALLDGVPADPGERDGDQKARATLAALTEYHHREMRNQWWEFIAAFEREDPAEDLDAPNTVAGLTFLEAIPPEGRKKNWRLRFSFPDQRIDLPGDQVFHELDFETGKVGTVDELDKENQELTLSVKAELADARPERLVSTPKNISQGLQAAIRELATSVTTIGFEGSLGRAAIDLLRRRPATFAHRPPEEPLRDDSPLLDNAVSLATTLETGVLAIQGPPGTGKTYTGAHLIAALVAQGRKVGVCALSHSAISNLLKAVRKHAPDIRVAHAGAGRDIDKDKGLQQVQDGELDVLGATSFVWCKPDARILDVLVIDEAGQLTLADTIAASMAAPRLILLGDPQQLEAPQQGSHPEGSGTAALAHFIGEHDTIPEHLGLLLDETYRLSSPLARFTSELFYEGKLKVADEGVANQAIHGDSQFAGAGFHTAFVEHTGNQSESVEEVEEVARIVDHLLTSQLTWTDRNGTEQPIGLDDILIVAPYNAQVGALRERLPQLKIGTVDKFQGQEAPIVIISMATSAPEDAPRGMEFLYSRNRLNVATSRARCAAILVASPALLEPECRTPGQMRLANGYAALAENAHS